MTFAAPYRIAQCTAVRDRIDGARIAVDGLIAPAQQKYHKQNGRWYAHEPQENVANRTLFVLVSLFHVSSFPLQGSIRRATSPTEPANRPTRCFRAAVNGTLARLYMLCLEYLRSEV